MYLHSRTKVLLACVLLLTMFATGCSAQWINTALADLPVLVQMALNIASLVTALRSGNQLSASEAAGIQNIANEAGKDLSLLQSLYNDYKAHPSDATLQRIQNLIAELNANLPALLNATHVSDPEIAARVTAAVNLIQSTVGSFASLIPQNKAAIHAGPRAVPVPLSEIVKPQELKKKWNEKVCAPTGRGEVDAALTACGVK